MVFQWSLIDLKSPQVSSTLLSILADLNNTIVLIGSIRSLFSDFQSSFQDFGDSCTCANPILYHRHSHVLQLSQFSGRVLIPFFLFALFDFHWVVH